MTYIIKNKFVSLAFVSALLMLSCFNTDAQSVRGAGIVSTCGRLQVKNAHVCSENGTRISLGGMSFFWSGWASKYYNAATVNYLVDNFKVSVVRAAYGCPADSGPMGDVQDVRNVIEAAIARGIYVIIDWHGEGDMTPYKAQEISFFQTMVHDYGNYNNVLYELWNEPTSQATSTIQAHCQDVANAIRAAENQYGYSHKLVICGSQTWSQYPNSYSINDPNAAYTFHGYFDNQPSHLSQLQNNVSAAMAQGNAVFVTEYGASYCNHTNTEQAIQWCQNNDISMTAWSVNDKPEDWSIFTNNMDALTCVGQYYQSKIVSWKAAAVVVTHPTAIAFTSSSVTLPSIGATAQLSLSFTPASTSDQTATYTSSNTSVATVDASGKVTAVAAGTATITATANDKTNGTLTATCTVTVKNLSNIALNKTVTVSSIESGATGSVVGSNAVDGNTTTRWSSAFADPQWIQVDLGASNKIYSVTLNWEAASAKDYTIQTSADATNWTTISTNTGMATGARIDNLSVSGTGRYVRMYGTARTSAYGYSLFEFSIYGEPDAVVAVTGVNIAPTSISVAPNATSQLTATVSPSNATNQNVTWSSSNAAVATVSASGLVTGVALGSATITVTTVDGGKTDVCSVTVANNAATGVTVSPATVSIGVNATSQLTATVSPSNATNKNVTWTSSNTAVATVSSTGLVTGVAQGTATITAKTVDGNFTATSSVTVTASTNMVTNGDFSNGLTAWSSYVDASASGSFSVSNGELYAGISNGGSQVWHFQLYQGNLNIVNGKTYTLSFTARANANRAITAIVEQNGGSYTLYGGGNNNFNLTTSNATYSFTFTMTQPTDANGRVTFNLGSSNIPVYIDNVSLTTSSSSGFSQKIEAESYASKTAAPQAETTTDVGGGQDMGWIGNADYMIYNVNIPTAGTYTISYRVASPNSTGKVILGKNGTDLTAAISVPNTGGWQNWQTISTTATLAAGSQSLTVYAQTGGFNINWWSISSAGARVSTPEVVAEQSVEHTFVAYPNPSNGSVTVEVSRPSHVSIVDVAGNVLHHDHVEHSKTFNDLRTGLYIVRMQFDGGSKTQKLIVK